MKEFHGRASARTDAEPVATVARTTRRPRCSGKGCERSLSRGKIVVRNKSHRPPRRAPTPGRPAPPHGPARLASALDLDGEVALEVLAERVSHTDVKRNVPALFGVPEISPLTDRASPFGRLPAIRCQTYGPTWPAPR